MAVLVVAGLGAGLVYTIMAGGEGGGPTPTLAAAPTSTAGLAGSATVTLPAPASSTLPPAQVPARIVTGTTVPTPPVVAALRSALTSWGQFAVTGRVGDLGDHFVAGGPQRRQLRAEAESIRATTSGGPPYSVTTGDIFTVSVTPTDVVLRTEIDWARRGEATQSFIWDIQMRLVDGRWQLLTVEEVDEEPGG
jgi:hypothetical protein